MLRTLFLPIARGYRHPLKTREALAFEASIAFTGRPIARVAMTDDARDDQQAFQQHHKPAGVGTHA